MTKELKVHTHIDYSLHDLLNMRFYLAADVDALLAEKDKEIESLKASHYAEMVDAGMRERRLRRALYIVLARLFCCMRELAARNALYDDECKWDNFKTTCLKKAEEYK